MEQKIDSLLMDDYRRDLSPLLNTISCDNTQIVGVGATANEDLRHCLSQYKSLSSLTEVNTLSRHCQITHTSIKVSESVRLSSLASLVAAQSIKTIVFANTVSEAKSIANHPILVSRSRVLHGDLEQAERDKILNLFRTGGVDILVCTDIAARGIDVPGVKLVISYKPPVDALGYIHRAGRTGRAGSTGESILLYSKLEKDKVEEIEEVGSFKFGHKECPSKLSQREIALEAIVNESVSVGQNLSEKRLEHISELLVKRRPESVNVVVANCLIALLGNMVDISPPKKSILSGEMGYSPVLFVDPGKVVIKSRGDLTLFLNKLGLKVGLVAASDSGYVVDLLTSDAVRLCYETDMAAGVETVLVDKLPRLNVDETSRGRKYNGVLPWRRKKK